MKTRKLLTALGCALSVSSTIPMVVSCNPTPVGPQYPTLALTYEQWEKWTPSITPVGGELKKSEATNKYLTIIKDNPTIVLEDCLNVWWVFHLATDFTKLSYSLIDVQPENQYISFRTYEESKIDGVSGTITTTYTNIKINVEHVQSDSGGRWNITPVNEEDYLKTNTDWSFTCVATGYTKETRDWYNAEYNSAVVSKDAELLDWAVEEISKFNWYSLYLSDTTPID